MFYFNQFVESLSNDWRNRKINSSYVNAEDIDRKITENRTKRNIPVKHIEIGGNHNFNIETLSVKCCRDIYMYPQFENKHKYFCEKFNRNLIMNPYVHADGEVFELTKPFYMLPKSSSPEEDFKNVFGYYDSLIRVFTNKASDNDAEIVGWNVQYLYDSNNANFFKILAWGVLHGFIVGVMDPEDICNLVPSFRSDKKYTSLYRIKAWNEAIDSVHDIDPTIRQMFMANSSGIVRALFLLIPDEDQEHPEDDIPVLDPTDNNTVVESIDDAPPRKKEEASKHTPIIVNLPVTVPPAPAQSQPKPKKEKETEPSIKEATVEKVKAVKHEPTPVEADPKKEAPKPYTPLPPFKKDPIPDVEEVDSINDLKIPNDQVTMKQAIIFGNGGPNDEKDSFTMDDLLNNNNNTSDHPKSEEKSVEHVDAEVVEEGGNKDPFDPAQPQSTPENWAMSYRVVDDHNNDDYHASIVGLDKFTKLVHDCNRIVNYSEMEAYPGIIKATIYDPEKVFAQDEHKNFVSTGWVAIDPRKIYGDTIRVVNLDQNRDIRDQVFIPLYQQDLIKKMILNQYNGEDNRFARNLDPREITEGTAKYRFIDRVDMSGIYEEHGDLTHDEWVKLIKNISKVLKNKKYQNIRFRVCNYKDPDLFNMVADDKVAYPFYSSIRGEYANVNAVNQRHEIDVNNHHSSGKGMVYYSDYIRRS